MKRLVVLFCLFLPLAACAQQPHALPKPAVLPPPKSIEAIDQSCSPPLEMIDKSHKVLRGVRFKNPTRVLWPSSAATMDFSPQRINFILDKKGIIRQIKCG